MTPRLSRAHASRPLAPARIVHLGVGAFHRAHQAVYTNNAPDAEGWGIAGFTGRSPAIADELTAQGGLYTVVERSSSADRLRVIESIVSVHSSSDIGRWVAAVCSPHTALLTTTVTEAGYGLTSQGVPNLVDPKVRKDLEALRTEIGSNDYLQAGTVLGRLILALERRRVLDLPGLAIVPCDNVPGNGSWLRGGLLAFASEVSTDLERWIEREISFVSTSVDRITPRSGPELSESVARETGVLDTVPVVTEPFSDWVLSGEFPLGRPLWENSGATFVTDIEHFEARKLWLLNGSHTLLAAQGRLRGHSTVSAAIGDPVCRSAVQAYWEEASRHLPAEVHAEVYVKALLDRFGNERIEHQLAQIGQDALGKLRHRIAPVAEAERGAGRPGSATAHAIACWIHAVRSQRSSTDAEQQAVDTALKQTDPDIELLALVAPRLAGDPVYRVSVLEALARVRNEDLASF